MPLVTPARPNEVWSADFMADALWSGRRFRTFNVMADFNCEVLRIEIDTNLPARRVVRALDELIELRGKPSALRLDNGPELISDGLVGTASSAGSSNLDGDAKRLRGTLQPNVSRGGARLLRVETLGEVRQMTAEWITRYNEIRRHESLGNLSPRRYLMAKSV